MIKKLITRNQRTDGDGQRMHRCGVPASRFETDTVWILDPHISRALIRERQERGIDRYDEVWEGVYVVSPLANLHHQDVVITLARILADVLDHPKGARVQAGANVSDRQDGWEKSFRDPDVVVVLAGSRAVDCGTHWCGGPDFLVEVKSPRDEIEQKVPFYGKIGVRELLVIDRDTHHLQLYRHDGKMLELVGKSDAKSKGWLDSEVMPLRFRCKASKTQNRIEIRRSDGKRGEWVV